MLQKYGMECALGGLGIAQGMWLHEEGASSAPAPAPAPASAHSVASAPAPAAQQGGGTDGPPSPWFFLAYVFLLPLPYVAAAIAGDYHNALTRFLFLIIVPFGILLATCAMVYDYWILLAHPEDLLRRGTKRFFPFTVLGWDADNHSPYIQSTPVIEPCPPDNFIVGTLKGVILLISSIVSIFSPATAQALREGVAAATMAKTIVVDGAYKGVETAGKVATVATRLPVAVGSAVSGASVPVVPKGPSVPTTTAAPAALPKVPSVPTTAAALPKVPSVPTAAAPVTTAAAPVTTTAAPVTTAAPSATHLVSNIRTPSATLAKGPVQHGGATKTPYDYAAFTSIAALIASGLVFTFNRSPKDDSPPNTGRV